MNVRQAMVGFVGVLALGCGDQHATSGSDSCGGKSATSWSQLTVLAGKPGGGAGANDGVGSAARFVNPDGLYADGAGNVYVADTYNYVIRKVVVATGAVSTLAGTPGLQGNVDAVGAAARFGFVSDITGDGAGNLYVPDGDNRTIRKIEIATGAVSTIAGSASSPGQSVDGVGSAAQFSGPFSITSDGNGTLFIVDDWSIRQLSLATGAVTTLAGNNDGFVGTPSDGVGQAANFGTLGHLAYDGAGILFVTDRNLVRKIDVASAMVTTLVGSPLVPASGSSDGIGSAAMLNGEGGIVSDGAGNLYVGDSGNDTIRKIVVATAAVTTIAGTPTVLGSSDGTGAAARFNSPAGLAFANGSLFVSDRLNSTLRQIDANSGVTTTLAGQAAHVGSSDGSGGDARFNTPLGVATDDHGNIYVADSNNYVIRKVTPAGVVTTIGGTLGQAGSSGGIGGTFNAPTAMISDGKDQLYIIDGGGAMVRRFTLSTREVVTIAGRDPSTFGSLDGPGPQAAFEDATGLALDGAGNLYVADYSASNLRKIVLATDIVSTIAGTANVYGSADGVGPAASFHGPAQIAYDSGSLYITDGMNDTIRKLDLATGAVTTPFGSAGVSGSVDGVGTAARFDQPSSMIGDGAGNLYVGDSAATLRHIVVKSGAVTTPIGSAGHFGVQPGALPAGLDTPGSLALLPCGGLVIVDGNEDVVLTVE